MGAIMSDTGGSVINDSNFLAKVCDHSNTEEFDACLHLRHSYFIRHRAWITCNGSGEKTDHCDPLCQHLAAFHNDHILASMRLLPWQPEHGFMLEHDFDCLLTDEERTALIHENSAELSRLTTAKGEHKHAYGCDVSHTLLAQSEHHIPGGSTEAGIIRRRPGGPQWN